jgi:putative ABC transport system permease protein
MMGIINRITKRTLQGEMGRTLLTILSMGIAATLVIATLVGFTSSQNSLYQRQLQDTGGMQFVIMDVPRGNVAKLRQNPGFKQSLAFANLGRMKLPKGIEDYDDLSRTGSPLVGMDKAALDQLIKPMIVTGRLPRNSTELVIPIDSTKGISFLNKRIKVQTAAGVKHFTVVGTINGYHEFGNAYRWITKNGQAATGTVNVAGVFTDVNRIRSRLATLAKQAGIGKSEQRIIFNEQAMRLLGAGRNMADNATIAGLLTMILTIIGLAAGMMIYTSINLSVRSRIQRYGLLRSIGATPKQIRQLVYREGLVLVLPVLALGYLLGIVGLAGVMAFLDQRFRASGLNMRLYLTMNPWALVGSALFMILITFLASARPAARAARVAPLAAVRDNMTTPRLKKRHLRPGLWQRLMPTPLSKLAAKNYRRNGGIRWTMIATLSISIVIFVGFTSFARSVLRDASNDYGASADISVQVNNNEMAGPLKKIQAIPNIKEAIVVKQDFLKLQKQKTGFDSRSIDVLIVPDTVFARYFDNKITLLNASQRRQNKAGQRKLYWLFPENFTGPLTFVRDTANPIRIAQTIPADTPILHSLANYSGGIVLSKAHYAALYKGKKAKKSVGVTFYMVLKNPKQHIKTMAELKQVIPTSNAFDRVAENEKTTSILTAAQVMVYGFLALLSLVSLANIINHIFANLLQRRRELAMLQAIGTTPPQVARMLGIENGRLFLTSLIWGSVLGTALSWILRQQLGDVYQIGFTLPWLEIAIVTLVLITVWLIFEWVSYRMIRKQNIDHWLRLT